MFNIGQISGYIEQISGVYQIFFRISAYIRRVSGISYIATMSSTTHYTTHMLNYHRDQDINLSLPLLQIDRGRKLHAGVTSYRTPALPGEARRGWRWRRSFRSSGEPGLLCRMIPVECTTRDRAMKRDRIPLIIFAHGTDRVMCVRFHWSRIQFVRF